MLRRLGIYLKEMYPIPSRLLVAGLIFFEIYFILLLNERVTNFSLGPAEAVATFTIFAFLLFLRIADDFKDYETDQRLFPDRPLPSGRVKKQDLWCLLSLVLLLAGLGNLIYMNNLAFFLLLFGYGFLMSFWFFARHKIQNNLLLAVVSHNPVMMILNWYIISFTAFKYHLPLVSRTTILLAFTLYFPSLIWEVSRKIRAPEDETDYVTYSKLFGHVRATRFVWILTLLDILTNLALVFPLNRPMAVLLLLNVAVLSWRFNRFIKKPKAFKLIDRVETHTLITEAVMILAVVLYLVFGPM